MRVRTLGSFIGGALLAGVVLWMPSEGTAQTAPPPAPPTSCSFNIATSSGPAAISVTAGPDGVAFPESVDCPAVAGSPLSGDCLRWRYKFTSGGPAIALSGVTLDSDLTGALASSGSSDETFTGSQVSNAGDGDTLLALAKNVFDVRVARFASNATTVYGNVYTPTNVAVGKVTGAARIGNGLGYCTIAGASNLTTSGAGKVATTTTILDVAGQCFIARQVDGQGCTVSMTSMSEGCTVQTFDNATLNGQTISGASCASQITFGANSNYCYASAFGRLVCVNSPSP